MSISPKNIKRFFAISVSFTISLFFSMPAFAVFNEKDINQTLSVLHYELKQEYENRADLEKKIFQSGDNQHLRIINIIKKCNELSLILYSQNQDYTFDMTYALKEVTSEYDNFSKDRMPYEKVLQRLDNEIERLDLLVASLKFLVTEDDVDREVPDSLMDILHEHNISENEVTVGLESVAERDSCQFYANRLLDIYKESKEKILTESSNFEQVKERLHESYDYAQNQYKTIQKEIFINGQDDYLTILSYFREYMDAAVDAIWSKYGFDASWEDWMSLRNSEWKGRTVMGFIIVMILLFAISVCLGTGIMAIAKRRMKFFANQANRKRIPGLRFFLASIILTVAITISSEVTSNHFFTMACKLMLVYLWLLSTIVLSLSIRKNTDNIASGMKVYMPNCILGFIIILFRITFIPNIAANLLFPPMLVGFTIWQLAACLKTRNKLDTMDSILGWVTFAIMAITTLTSLAGYVLMGVQVIIWWLFQLAAIVTVMILADATFLYKKNRIDPKLESHKKERVSVPALKSGFNIRYTWLFDFVSMTFVPVIAILTIPQCLWEAADIFDLTSVLAEKFHEPFFDIVTSDGSTILRLSAGKIILSLSLFFIFRYFNYLLRSVYAVLSIKKVKRVSGRETVKANEVNLTLASNVIAILIWGTYITTLVILLKIPVGAISLIAAGLATGLGLAMKDILNNFIYGIQLMSGRLRVGDYIECDGIRGQVNEISYQSTQLETIDGAVMSFLNADLFSRNFKNLTRNNDYEFLKVIVGVAYGTDIDKARTVILEAVKGLQEEKDKFGRTTVDLKNEISVVVEELADSSVNLAVRQYVLVSEKIIYRVKAQECIYNALAAAGITIPFPQLDVHNKQD